MEVEAPLPEDVEREPPEEFEREPLPEEVERELPEELEREPPEDEEEDEDLDEEFPEDEEREPPEDEEEDEDLDEEDLDEEDLDEEESSSRDPQVSLVLSSTSRAERETDGLRELSPGRSTEVSSNWGMTSSMRPPPTGLLPEPAKRIGMAKNVAANAVRMYLIAVSPVKRGSKTKRTYQKTIIVSIL